MESFDRLSTGTVGANDPTAVTLIVMRRYIVLNYQDVHICGSCEHAPPLKLIKYFFSSSLPLSTTDRQLVPTRGSAVVLPFSSHSA